MKLLLVICATLFLSSCATTMPGSDLKLESNLLSATYKLNSTFSSDTTKMYQISISNLSNSWIDIDSVTLSDPSASVQILIGSKMNAWIEACRLEKEVSDYNTALLLGSLAITGAVVNGVSSNSSTANIGHTVSMGAITAAGLKAFVDTKNYVEFQSLLPETHLLRSFYIPSQKVIQRWIIVENPKNVNLKFTLNSKVKEVGALSFEISPNPSN